MKNVLLGTVALIALTAPAASADLAARPYAKASPIVIPIFDWTGFYIGINGAGSTAHQCWDVANAAGLVFAPPRGMGCHNATGGTFGGQIGYGRQIANSVFDLAAQGNWPNLSGSNSNLAFVGVQDGTKIDAFGLFTGQVGYTWNNMLLYVKSGAPVVRNKYRVFDFTTGMNVDNGSETRWGGAVGTGLEFDFARNWSIGVEYDHLFTAHRDADFFFSTGLVGGPAGAFAGTARIGQDVDIGLIRVNYRWGGAGGCEILSPSESAYWTIGAALPYDGGQKAVELPVNGVYNASSKLEINRVDRVCLPRVDTGDSGRGATHLDMEQPVRLNPGGQQLRPEHRRDFRHLYEQRNQ